MKTACLPLLAALSWALTAHAAVPDRAGEVTFLIGEARITSGPDTGSTLRRGSAVMPGQQIETSDNGHLHIRFVDGAAVAVRPMTRLRIDDYTYAPNDPSQNRIRFFLQEGALRSITGKAGEATKDRFRINTPVAAIGIRGTDFNVQTTGDLTRASLFQGAIILSPLGAQCSSATLGPCLGASARELDELLRGVYAVQAGTSEAVAQFVPKHLDVVPKPQLVASAPAAERSATSRMPPVVLAEGPDAAKQQNEGVATEVVASHRADQLAEIIPSILPPDVPASNNAKPVEVALTREANPHIWWGRWAAYADPTDANNSRDARFIPGRTEEVGGNKYLSLMRLYIGQSQLPTAGGQASFALSNYEAQTYSNGTFTRATITAASLSMNFDTRRFATQLSVAPANSAALTLNAVGSIASTGNFYSDSFQDMRLNGAIANKGQQAGYAFERQLDLNTQLFGATAWTR